MTRSTPSSNAAGERLFALLGRPARFKQVPVALLDTIIAVLGLLGRVLPPLTNARGTGAVR